MKKRVSDISGIVTLEYAAIAVLVLLGILVMGPSIVRSINAYFQSMDEGVKDSFREEFKYATADDISVEEGDGCTYFTSYQCSSTYPHRLASLTSSNSATCYELLAREGGTTEYFLTDEEVDDYYGWNSGGTPIRYTWDNCPIDPEYRSESTHISGLGLDGHSSDKPCGLECCQTAQPRSVCECLDSVAEISDCPEDRLVRYYTQKCGTNLEDQGFWELDPECRVLCEAEPDESSASEGSWCSGETIPHHPLDQEPPPKLPLKFVPWGPSLKFCNEDGLSGDPDNGPEDICDPEKTVSETDCDACYAECDQTFLPYDGSEPAWVGTYCACPPGWESVTLESDGCPDGYTRQSSCPGDSAEYDLNSICWYEEFLSGAAFSECP